MRGGTWRQEPTKRQHSPLLRLGCGGCRDRCPKRYARSRTTQAQHGCARPRCCWLYRNLIVPRFLVFYLWVPKMFVYSMTCDNPWHTKRSGQNNPVGMSDRSCKLSLTGWPRRTSNSVMQSASFVTHWARVWVPNMSCPYPSSPGCLVFKARRSKRQLFPTFFSFECPHRQY